MLLSYGEFRCFGRPAGSGPPRLVLQVSNIMLNGILWVRGVSELHDPCAGAGVSGP